MTSGRSATSSRCRAGHTASCIQKCKYIWTGGPARRSDQDFLGTIINADPAQPLSLTNRLIGDGRPMWVTDLTDPENPEVSEQPIDLWRNDGYTDYSHDVDEDEQGIAWVSGRGGIRGYATSGRHRDPYLNQWRRATPFEPILVAGGGLEWDNPNVQGDDGVAQPTMFMHNSGRPTGGSVRASGVRRGNVLVGTEEDFTTPCGQSGRIVLSDITDSLGRRARAAVHACQAVPDEDAGLLPPVPRHAGDGEPRSRVLGALLRDRGTDARRGVVRPGPASAGHRRRARRRAGRLLPRHGHDHGHGAPTRRRTRGTSRSATTAGAAT